MLTLTWYTATLYAIAQPPQHTPPYSLRGWMMARLFPTSWVASLPFTTVVFAACHDGGCSEMSFVSRWLSPPATFAS